MSLGHSLRLAFRRATSLREGGKASILLLYKLQYKELLWSRGPKNVSRSPELVTNWPSGLPDKLQFEAQYRIEGP